MQHSTTTKRYGEAGETGNPQSLIRNPQAGCTEATSGDRDRLFLPFLPDCVAVRSSPPTSIRTRQGQSRDDTQARVGGGGEPHHISDLRSAIWDLGSSPSSLGSAICDLGSSRAPCNPVSRLLSLTPHLHRGSDLHRVAALSSGLAPLDEALPNGGFPRGRLTELRGPMMSGKLTVAQHAVGAALTGGRRCAWVDLPGTFYPADLAPADTLENLLVLRPREAEAALRAADILVTGREWDLIVIDATGHYRALTQERLKRLTGALRGTRATVLLLHDCPARSLGGLVTLRLGVRRRLTAGGRSLEVTVEKNKLASPGRRIRIPLSTTVAT